MIDGGVPLSGTVVPAGNKNGALPVLAACVLTSDEVILRNVPRIAASTASMWRRSDSDSVHSQTSAQASSREGRPLIIRLLP